MQPAAQQARASAALRAQQWRWSLLSRWGACAGLTAPELPSRAGRARVRGTLQQLIEGSRAAYVSV